MSEIGGRPEGCDFCKQGIKHQHHHRHADNLNRCLYDDEQGISRCDFDTTGVLGEGPPVLIPVNWTRPEASPDFSKLLADWLDWAEQWGDHDARQSLIARTKAALKQ